MTNEEARKVLEKLTNFGTVVFLGMTIRKGSKRMRYEPNAGDTHVEISGRFTIEEMQALGLYFLNPKGVAG